MTVVLYSYQAKNERGIIITYNFEIRLRIIARKAKV